jgi:hypothetical protein
MADIPPSAQVSAIDRLGISKILGITHADIIVETSKPPKIMMKSTSQRLTGSTSDCYTELVIRRLYYVSRPVLGEAVGASIILRRYPRSSSHPIIDRGYDDAELRLYPNNGYEQHAQAIDELRDGFSHLIRDFIEKHIHYQVK